MRQYLFIANKLVKTFAFLIAFLLPSLCLAGNTITSSDKSTNIPDKLVIGYWHNWSDGTGYLLGKSPSIQLKDIDSRYNVIMVSFMKVYLGQNSRIPTFKLDSAGVGMSDEQFIEQIKLLQSQGRLVVLSLGGADAHIELQKNDVNDFANEIIRLTDYYGFNGLDIDLEQVAIAAGDNQQVIPEALKIVRKHYSKQKKHFTISMAPEFPYLRTSIGNYIPYMEALEDSYDWVSPQFYNQRGDGIYISKYGYIAQNNDSLKQEFIYYISKAIIDGTEYYQIPHDKLVFGLPANVDAAGDGYVKNPNDLIKVFDQLAQEGTPLRGIMTWSVNWDIGYSVNGKNYNSSFINAYGDYFKQSKIYNKSPVIFGTENITLPVNSDFDPMADVIATDAEDGYLTDKIKVTGFLDIDKIGDYELTYTVTDSAYNTTTAKRMVYIVGDQPKITGIEDTTIKLGEKFDPLSGVKAINNTGEDITENLVVRGDVITDLLVEAYKLVYNVTDNYGNSTSAVRIVEVIADSNDLVTTITSDIKEMDTKKQYVAGDKVKYKGKIYIAQRWTDLGVTPDSKYSGWKLFIDAI